MPVTCDRRRSVPPMKVMILLSLRVLSAQWIARKVVSEFDEIFWRLRCVTGNKQLEFTGSPAHGAVTGEVFARIVANAG